MVQVGQAEESSSGALPSYDTAHVFRPPSRDGAIAAVASGGFALVFGLALLIRGSLRGISFATFGGDIIGVALLALGGVVLYWAYALYELRYVVDDDSLVIVWGLTRIVIPVDQIQRIVLGQKQGEPRVQGISWRGCHIGRARVPRFGQVLFYSAHRSAAEIVYVSAAETHFGLSLGDPRALARAVQAAQDSARVASAPAIATYRVIPAQGILRDRTALLIAGSALLAFLLAAGYIYSRYQALPPSLAIDYPPTNGPQRIGDRGELLRLPLTALLWLVLGYALAVWAHIQQRTVSYVLLLGTLFAECLFAVAALAAAH